MAEVVKYQRRMAAVKERLHRVDADESGAARYDDPHVLTSRARPIAA